jgi:hypothetical protein
MTLVGQTTGHDAHTTYERRHTTLTVCGKSTHEISSAMNHDLNNVNDWLMANKLCLNLSKTEYMLIGSDPDTASIILLIILVFLLMVNF